MNTEPKMRHKLATESSEAPSENADRLTAVLQLHHVAIGQGTKTVSPKFSQLLMQREQPWSRYLTISQQWTEIDLGWLKGKSGLLLVLINKEKPFQTTSGAPSGPNSVALERESHSRCIDYTVGEADSYFTIAPGRFAVIEVGAGTLRWRSASPEGSNVEIFAVTG